MFSSEKYDSLNKLCIELHIYICFALKAALLKLLISAASVQEGASTSISVDF